jgi:choline transporter-like protein 2/4/5
MADEKKEVSDPYQKYKDFQWENPDEFRNGPIGDESRKCRDIICCIFFIVFLVACVVVAILGFVKGHPSYLLYAYDEDGKACGHSDGYEDYPYLYFYSVVSNVKSLNTDSIINGVCVKECPKVNHNTKEAPFYLSCHPSKKNANCEVKREIIINPKLFLIEFVFQ